MVFGAIECPPILTDKPTITYLYTKSRLKKAIIMFPWFLFLARPTGSYLKRVLRKLVTAEMRRRCKRGEGPNFSTREKETYKYRVALIVVWHRLWQQWKPQSQPEVPTPTDNNVPWGLTCPGNYLGWSTQGKISNKSHHRLTVSVPVKTNLFFPGRCNRGGALYLVIFKDTVPLWITRSMENSRDLFIDNGCN